MIQDNFNQRVLKIRSLLNSKQVPCPAAQVAEANMATPDGSCDQREKSSGWSDFNNWTNTQMSAPTEKFSDFSDFNNAPIGSQAFHAVNT